MALQNDRQAFRPGEEMKPAMEAWVQQMLVQAGPLCGARAEQIKVLPNSVRCTIFDWGFWEANNDLPRGDDGARAFEATNESYQEAERIRQSIRKQWPDYTYEFEFGHHQVFLRITNRFKKNQ